MNNRFEPASEVVIQKIRDMIRGYFPELVNAKIMAIFDTKKKSSKGNIVLASIHRVNEFEKFLTADQATDYEGYDYIMTVNFKAWDLGSDQDRTRLIRHELRHTVIDENSKNPYKLRGHSIEDFYSEIALNEDDPRWAQSLTMKVFSAYEMEKEDE